MTLPMRLTWGTDQKGITPWYEGVVAPTAPMFLAVDDNPNVEASEDKEDCHIGTLSNHQER